MRTSVWSSSRDAAPQPPRGSPGATGRAPLPPSRWTTTTTIQVDPHTWAFPRDPGATYPDPGRPTRAGMGQDSRPWIQTICCPKQGPPPRYRLQLQQHFIPQSSQHLPQILNWLQPSLANTSETPQSPREATPCSSRTPGTAALGQARVCRQTATAGHLPRASAGTAKGGSTPRQPPPSTGGGDAPRLPPQADPGQGGDAWTGALSARNTSGSTCPCRHRSSEPGRRPTLHTGAAPGTQPSPGSLAAFNPTYQPPRNVFQIHRSTKASGIHSSWDKASCPQAKGSPAAPSQAFERGLRNADPSGARRSNCSRGRRAGAQRNLWSK